MSCERLLKCPFCGGVPIVFESSNGPFAFGKYVVCEKCGCQTLLYTGKDAEEKAIESWNNRKPVEDVLERLEKKIKPLHNPNWNAAIEESIQIIKGELL